MSIENILFSMLAVGGFVSLGASIYLVQKDRKEWGWFFFLTLVIFWTAAGMANNLIN